MTARSATGGREQALAELLVPTEAPARPQPRPGHAAAVLEAWRRRADAEGLFVPTAARSWRRRVYGPGGAA